jgi:hypothetical protein
MMSRRCALFATLLLPSLSAQSVQAPRHAVAAAAFGPEFFVRSQGAPVVETRQFSRGLLRGPVTLVVVNGDAAQNGRVAGATITLNGTPLFGADDFRRTTLQKPVELLPQNTLTVELQGAPGGFLAIAVGGYAYEFAAGYSAIPLASETPFEGTIDWRTKGAVTPVKNQGECGADWAFSATGAAEGSWQIAKGQLTSLSEQQLVDCSGAYGNFGCNGGDPSRALDYLVPRGAESEAAYPYTARDGACKYSAPRVAAKFQSVQRVPPGDESTLRSAVANNGPVSVILNVGPWFQQYHAGIANPTGCGVDYQAVLIVGFESTGSTPYWIVKNSWGTSWGEQGYIRIAMNQNKCGIADFAVFPKS